MLLSAQGPSLQPHLLPQCPRVPGPSAAASAPTTGAPTLREAGLGGGSRAPLPEAFPCLLPGARGLRGSWEQAGLISPPHHRHSPRALHLVRETAGKSQGVWNCRECWPRAGGGCRRGSRPEPLASAVLFGRVHGCQGIRAATMNVQHDLSSTRACKTRMCTHMHAHGQHTCAQACTRTLARECTRAHPRTHEACTEYTARKHTRVHARHVCAHLHSHVHVYMSACTRTCTQVCTCTHTHTRQGRDQTGCAELRCSHPRRPPGPRW